MIINCPECGKEISNESKQCVHCGYPIARHLAEQKQKKKLKRGKNF